MRRTHSGCRERHLVRTIHALLDSHLRAFNHGVRTGDFSAILSMYRLDAVFELADPIATTHHGLNAIRRVYRLDPPRGTMRLRGAIVTGRVVTADYLWDGEPGRIAGKLTLEFYGNLIQRMHVTFAPD